jgi:hypothetical protein
MTRALAAYQQMRKSGGTCLLDRRGTSRIIKQSRPLKAQQG